MAQPIFPEAITPDVIAKVRDVALLAGEEIMRIYATDFTVDTKSDDSPVTLADKAAEAVITPVLEQIWPDVPIVAEEAFADGYIPDVEGKAFWLVDPLDGTKQFVSRKKEFTVNIALIVDGRPVFGVVHAPALDDTYIGTPAGATLSEGGHAPHPISTRTAPADGIVAVVSRSHKTPQVDEFLRDYTVAEEISTGSSIKFCMVATGQADLYPRFGRTMEWDTAAGQAVLEAARGEVVHEDGRPFRYGKSGFENPNFIARGRGL